MCKITLKIKFCTCKATSTEKLQNYWALYRRNKDKNIEIIGEVKLPNELFNKDYPANQILLEKRLNEADAFDVIMDFRAKDLLEIVFNSQDCDKRMVYGFKYTKATWIVYETDSFYLYGYCDEVAFGKIKNK